MDAAVRQLVRTRAGNRCEYCRLPQSAAEATFHVEHIIAEQHALPGADDPSNLALACSRCNLHKGTNLSSVDTETTAIVPLFHPRHDRWSEHFRLQGAEIVGVTPTGRATVRLLKMNARRRVELRATLLAAGEFDG